MRAVDEAEVEVSLQSSAGANESNMVYTVRRDGSGWKVTKK
jgi:hypothetical protein